MAVYYNEYDPFAAAWLRELIKAGHIAPGEVDERSIDDVRPADLVGFTQHHFFAGIGIWSVALRRAGWPDDRPVWTGSCPCQPFSGGGKREGFADPRHKWPSFWWLIQQCRPPVIFGEQVASPDGLAWLDLVQNDLEAADYAFGAVDTCAAGFGAPHIRQRLYWVADSHNQRSAPLLGAIPTKLHPIRNCGRSFAGSECSCTTDWLADPNRNGHGGHTGTGRQKERWAEYSGATCRMDYSGAARLQGRGNNSALTITGNKQGQIISGNDGTADSHSDPGPVNGLWAAADWLRCRDGKWRPVMPETSPLAPTGTYRNRVGLLRGAGNAVNLAQAKGFIEAYLTR